MTPSLTNASQRVPLGTKLAYGLGAAAYGIKENGFSVFLLIFYNQVIGLPASAVGAVIALALVFDAMIDPVLGVMSDRTHTRWGRRHPWLYASALPIALTWLLLWHPPQGTEGQVLAYLGVIAVLTRAAIATNEVPSLAMAPELTQDYNERTAVLRFRYLFGWLGGMAMLMLAYGVFLAGRTTPQELRDGYEAYGRFGGVVMGIAVLISAIGTHRRMAKPPATRISVKPVPEIAREMRQTLSNRAFLVLMISGIFAYTVQGVGFAVSQYNLTYVWQFSAADFLAYSVALIVGVIVIVLVVTPISNALGKVRAAMLLTVVGATFVCSTYTLRLLGIMPPVGSAMLFPVFVTLNTIGTASGVGAMILGASMMSDVVEDSEERTGRREEGLFFAGALFMQKCATGLGIVITGFILDAAAFPTGVAAGAVPVEVLDRYTLIFIMVTMSLSIVAAAMFTRFPFGRAEHEARVLKLAAQRG